VVDIDLRDAPKPIPRPSEELLWFAIDLDGTLAEAWKPGDDAYSIGAPIWDNIKKCREVSRAGYKVVIHTARPWSDFELIEWWLRHHFVSYHRIVCGKLMAKYYIDDRNGPSIDAESWLPE
jgi:hypothetical protein